MRIIHIITRLILGGAQENTLITCRELAARGHDVVLITGPAVGPEGSLFEQTKNAKYKTIVIDELIRPIRPLPDRRAYKKIYKLLKKLQPEIVHTHSAKAGILGRLAAGKIKMQNHERKTPFIVHTVHGLAFHPYQNRLENRLFVAIEKYAAKYTDAFISVADAMTQQMLAEGIGRPEMFTTAYSAIDEDVFLSPVPQEQIAAFRKQHDIPSNAVVLISIGRLFYLKGHEYIIESAKTIAKQFPNVVWLFVGDGLLKNNLQQRIKSAGLENQFRFTGLVPPQQIPLVLQASDILVHCSLREGLARVLPQAMLCGKATIAFDVDGNREVVNENTGRLIKPKNIEQLTKACVELIEDKSLRDRLGQNGRELVKDMFSPKTMVDKIEALYRRLVFPRE